VLVHPHFTNNRLANIQYLIACPETGEAAAIDPWDADALYKIAKKEGYEIRHILNTHSHWDHIYGNTALIERTGANVYCHPHACSEIGQNAKGLDGGTRFSIGYRELHVLDTPGHTMSHICLRGESDAPFLISGDTLFHAGAGNCHNGGDPEILYETFRDQLWSLADNTVLLPGHAYMENNLRFALSREPSNQYAQDTLNQFGSVNPLLTTIADERKYNPFFRLASEEILSGLKAADPAAELSSIRSRFLAMRRLRNHW